MPVELLRRNKDGVWNDNEITFENIDPLEQKDVPEVKFRSYIDGIVIRIDTNELAPQHADILFASLTHENAEKLRDWLTVHLERPEVKKWKEEDKQP